MPIQIQKRVRANRQNAKHSTGPRTPKGKAKSSQNALKHGILAESVVIPNCEQLESAEKFNALLADLIDELRPVGTIEEMLVETVAVSYWRLSRALRYEAAEIASRVDARKDWNFSDPIGCASLPFVEKTHMILRYETTIERRLHRALSSLYRHQAIRKAKSASIASPLSAKRPASYPPISSYHSPSSYPPQMESSPPLEPQSQTEDPSSAQFQKLPNEPKSPLDDEQHSLMRE